MRVHFTNLFGQSPRSVALIAQNDTMKIAKELGANELAIYFYDNSQESSGELNSRLDGMAILSSSSRRRGIVSLGILASFINLGQCKPNL